MKEVVDQQASLRRTQKYFPVHPQIPQHVDSTPRDRAGTPVQAASWAYPQNLAQHLSTGSRAQLDAHPS